MVATQMILGSATAALLATQAGRPVVDDPQKDAAIKATVGLLLILASVMVKNGWAKQVLIGFGAGLTVGTITVYFGR